MPPALEGALYRGCPSSRVPFIEGALLRGCPSSRLPFFEVALLRGCPRPRPRPPAPSRRAVRASRECARVPVCVWQLPEPRHEIHASPNRASPLGPCIWTARTLVNPHHARWAAATPACHAMPACRLRTAHGRPCPRPSATAPPKRLKWARLLPALPAAHPKDAPHRLPTDYPSM